MALDTMHEGSTDLPPEIADRFTKPFARFLKIKIATGMMLFLAAASALILSNSAWSAPFSAFWEISLGLHFGSLDFTRSLRHWVNEGLMTLFFFVVALELKRALVLGKLRVLRVVALSLAGAAGGMLVPAVLDLALMNNPLGVQSWGTVVATDTAFVIGCLALLGSRIPPSLRLFLLSLAIFDDVGAILVVAVSYGDAPNWAAVGLAAFGLIATLGAALIGIRNAVVYCLLASMIWLCLDASGINPTLTGVALGLMTSTHGWVSNDRLHAILERVLAYPRGEHWSEDTDDRRDLQRAGVAIAETLSPRRAAGNVAAPLGGLCDHATVCIRQCRSLDLWCGHRKSGLHSNLCGFGFRQTDRCDRRQLARGTPRPRVPAI